MDQLDAAHVLFCKNEINIAWPSSEDGESWETITITRDPDTGEKDMEYASPVCPPEEWMGEGAVVSSVPLFDLLEAAKEALDEGT